MSTAAQLEANQTNALLSTGPTTEAGKQKSSLNAIKHGFSGQKLVLTDDQKEGYQFHTLALTERYAAVTHEESSLLQQYIDLQWTLHQIDVQQMNLLSVINDITARLTHSGDLESIIPSTAPHFKLLGTLGTYEVRRRRSSADVLARLLAMIEERKAREASELAQAVALYKAHKADNKPFHPAEFGFVCSTPQIERQIALELRRATIKATAQLSR